MIITCLISAAISSGAQNTAETVIAAGRAVVELVTVLQKAKGAIPYKANETITDSCAAKLQADVCFRNATSKELSISVYRRNDSAYDNHAFTVRVLKKKKECLFELKSGIYKYRIEADEGKEKQLLSEGEFRLQPCDNMIREIRQ